VPIRAGSKEIDDLAPALDLGRAELQALVPSTGPPSGVGKLRHVGAPLGRILLRADDGRPARAKVRPLASASSISRLKWFQASPARTGSTPFTRNMVDGYIMSSWPSGPLPFKRRTGMRGQVAVARTVDEGFRQHRRAAGAGLDQQRADLAGANSSPRRPPCAWNSSCAPLASTSSSAATLKAALS
jgi:hypothetical protein